MAHPDENLLLESIDNYSLGEFRSIAETLSKIADIEFEVICAVSPDDNDVVSPIIISSEHNVYDEHKHWLPRGYGDQKAYIETLIQLKTLMPELYTPNTATILSEEGDGLDRNILKLLFARLETACRRLSHLQ